MKYMIDTRNISTKKPSLIESRLKLWKLNELDIMGLSMPYNTKDASINIELTQFNSQDDYLKAINLALELLNEYKPVPEPIRSKLILEAENFRQNGKDSLLI